MNAIPVTLNLPEDLVVRAREKGLLEDEAAIQLFEDEIVRLEEEAEHKWEASFENEDFDEAFSEDGTIDFNKLRALGKVMTLEDFRPD